MDHIAGFQVHKRSKTLDWRVSLLAQQAGQVSTQMIIRIFWCIFLA